MTDLDELKRLAHAATPGEWRIEAFTSVVSLRADRGCLIEWLNPSEGDKADASFIAAANPAAVLALIERVEESERRASVRQQLLDAEKAERDALREHQAEERNTWARALEQAVSERDAYKARVSRLEALARKWLARAQEALKEEA